MPDVGRESMVWKWKIVVRTPMGEPTTIFSLFVSIVLDASRGMTGIAAQVVSGVCDFAKGANAILVVDDSHIGVGHGGIGYTVCGRFYAMRIMAGGAGGLESLLPLPSLSQFT